MSRVIEPSCSIVSCVAEVCSRVSSVSPTHPTMKLKSLIAVRVPDIRKDVKDVAQGVRDGRDENEDDDDKEEEEDEDGDNEKDKEDKEDEGDEDEDEDDNDDFVAATEFGIGIGVGIEIEIEIGVKVGVGIGIGSIRNALDSNNCNLGNRRPRSSIVQTSPSATALSS